jgi:alpha 1,3-glucosidase
MFGTTTGPKDNQNILGTLTGFAPMPPIHSLGFHYCKYEQNSAELMIQRNADFTYYGFPVDVFWTDLYYTQDFEYFVFNSETWPIWQVQELNAALEQSKRRFVTINDPHMYANDTYWIYAEGTAMQDAVQPPGNITNVFIREPDAQTTYIAACWPGLSAWFDYLNTNAAAFWGSLY